MRKIGRSFAVAVISLGLLAATIGAAEAAGALAVGTCGAYGYGFDYRTASDARLAAMHKCSGADCRIEWRGGGSERSEAAIESAIGALITRYFSNTFDGSKG